MDLKDIGINTRNWVDSVQDRDYWRAPVNATLNLRVPLVSVYRNLPFTEDEIRMFSYLSGIFRELIGITVTNQSSSQSWMNIIPIQSCLINLKYVVLSTMIIKCIQVIICLNQQQSI